MGDSWDMLYQTISHTIKNKYKTTIFIDVWWPRRVAILPIWSSGFPLWFCYIAIVFISLFSPNFSQPCKGHWTRTCGMWSLQSRYSPWPWSPPVLAIQDVPLGAPMLAIEDVPPPVPDAVPEGGEDDESGNWHLAGDGGRRWWHRRLGFWEPWVVLIWRKVQKKSNLSWHINANFLERRLWTHQDPKRESPE